MMTLSMSSIDRTFRPNLQFISSTR